ncbi:MAG: metalloregulator ArsR/SmtB family transcription factor [Patescibacteria group bacterium]
MTDFCKKIQKLGKGISSPSRYRILELLMTGPKTVSELVINIKLTQPAVSQHLATLRTCGLVESSKKGQEVYYTLDTRQMLTVLKVLTDDVQKCKNA